MENKMKHILKEIEKMKKRVAVPSEEEMAVLDEEGISGINLFITMTYFQKSDDDGLKYKRIVCHTDIEGTKCYDEEAKLVFELDGFFYLKHISKLYPHLSLKSVWEENT